MAVYPKQLPQPYRGADLMREGLLSIKEATKFLGVCRQTVYNLMDDGKLPFVVVAGFRGRRIPKVVLRIFAEEM
jgi:excisionase family DNA binding protein